MDLFIELDQAPKKLHSLNLPQLVSWAHFQGDVGIRCLRKLLEFTQVHNLNALTPEQE